MQKVFDSESSSIIITPENLTRETISVREVGKTQNAAILNRYIKADKHFVICFIASGFCSFDKKEIHAPTVIAISPNKQNHSWENAGCNNLKLLWIKCSGVMLDVILRNAGLYPDANAVSCKYIDEAEKIFDELTTPESYSEKNDGLFMLSEFFKLLSLHSGSNLCNTENVISPYTQTVLDYIHKNFHLHITEKDMASLVNLSTNYMHKVFLSDVGQTPIYYLNLYRINQSKILLCNTDYSISYVADKVGISGNDYFCRVFRKYNDGASPTEYRKKMRCRNQK